MTGLAEEVRAAVQLMRALANRLEATLGEPSKPPAAATPKPAANRPAPPLLALLSPSALPPLAEDAIEVAVVDGREKRKLRRWRDHLDGDRMVRVPYGPSTGLPLAEAKQSLLDHLADFAKDQSNAYQIALAAGVAHELARRAGTASPPATFTDDDIPF